MSVKITTYKVGDIGQFIGSSDGVVTVVKTRMRARSVLGLQSLTVRDSKGRVWQNWNSNFQPEKGGAK